MTYEAKYSHRQYVYLVHDPEQVPRMIVEIHLVTPKLRRYLLACGTEISDHYEHELSDTKDVLKATTNKNKEE